MYSVVSMMGLQTGTQETQNADLRQRQIRVWAIVAEANNMGGPLVEQLRGRYPVQPFVTTNATKKEIIDDLALGMEQGAFRILNDAVQIGELLSFEQTRLPSGLWRYAAAGNGHDDTVMALALAKHAANVTPAVGGNVGVWRR